MINSETKLIGIIGKPITHSKSPIMHNTLFSYHGLNYRYVAFNLDRENLEEAIRGIRALKFRGLNVTIPYKVDVIPYLDEIAEDAIAIGAVNTIVNDDGRLIGYNTDSDGYIRSLIEETGIALQGKKILMLGTGGAARAIGYGLVKSNIESLAIASRKELNAERLAHDIGSNNIATVSYDEIESFARNADIIINTTPVGMYPNIDNTLINSEWFNSNQIVSDIIYNPLETKLLKDAREKGATTHNGLGMFVYQGLIAFEKWTGITPDPVMMRKTVIDTL